jgi:hypothetical protein
VGGRGKRDFVVLTDRKANRAGDHDWDGYRSLGLGFGRYGDGRVGVTLDLGVAFMGENDLLLSASGPIASDATFRQELEKERVSVEADLRRYTRLFPVLNLGFHVAL